ncbi:MAG: hypothetical protein LC775_19190, partial [Acidobacteria bacterium]|nr:hypothetical protein [Acidobacteriota bacterium]
MKDAAFEAKRDAEPDGPNLSTDTQLATSVGNYEPRVRATLHEAAGADVMGRIWKRDPSLWKSEESHQKIIRNSLGWLTVAAEMLRTVPDLRSFAENIRASGVQHVMVCGMGGSSLCPEVLRQTFG